MPSITRTVPASFIADDNLGFDKEYECNGRVTLFRKQGGVSFGQFSDKGGTLRAQFMLSKRELGEESYKKLTSEIKLGSYVYLFGKKIRSSTNMPTLLVTKGTVLASPMIPFPDKFAGVSEETARKQKYLASWFDNKHVAAARIRADLYRVLRSVLDEQGFLEIETRTMGPAASGAMANPFVTHHKALDRDMFLRIAPETSLKMAVAGGLPMVYEIGRNYRNEGIDPTHLQEFSAVEWYAAYWNYMDNLELFRNFLIELNGFFNDTYGTITPFSSNFEVVSYRELMIDAYGNSSWIHDMTATECDRFFKENVRSKITAGTVLVDYPAYLSPMAKRSEENPDFIEQWQYIYKGAELVKCYTELTDPVLQRQLLEEQARQKANGDEETMMVDEAFLTAMEHGMPPMSGLGMGLDRMVAILSGIDDLRDCVW